MLSNPPERVSLATIPVRFRERTLAGYVPGTASQRLALDAAERLVEGEIRNLVLVGPPGVGKMAPLDEPVLTPDGWRAMGDLQPGDAVIGSDGLGTPVLGWFPQGRREIVRVTFSDGSWTRCGWEHLWTVVEDDSRTRRRLTFTTREMAARLHQNWQLPLVEPPQHTPVDLPVDPYTLGVLLGDGYLGSLSSPSIEITTEDEIALSLPLELIHRRRISEGVSTYYVRRGPIYDHLEALGLRRHRAWEKHVPPAYLMGAPADRLALLQGLLDADGWAGVTGCAEIVTTALPLAEAARQIAQSLGGIARGPRPTVKRFTYKGESRQGRPAWRVRVKLPLPLVPFRYARKAAAFVPPSKYPPVRVLRSIELEGESEAACIKVANPDGLYVTREYILTHNTHLAAAAARAVAERDRDTFDAARAANPERYPALPALPLWLNVADAIVRMRLEMDRPRDDRGTTDDVIHAHTHPGLLVLDDLGREKVSDWTGELVYALVNARYEALRPTIVTSNLTAAELAAGPYWAAISRLAEDGDLVKIDAPDRRLAP